MFINPPYYICVYIYIYILLYIDCVKPLEDRLGKVQPLKEAGGGPRIGRGTGTNSEGRLKK